MKVINVKWARLLIAIIASLCSVLIGVGIYLAVASTLRFVFSDAHPAVLAIIAAWFGAGIVIIYEQSKTL